MREHRGVWGENPRQVSAARDKRSASVRASGNSPVERESSLVERESSPVEREWQLACREGSGNLPKVSSVWISADKIVSMKAWMFESKDGLFGFAGFVVLFEDDLLFLVVAQEQLFLGGFLLATESSTF